jgi:hypothetical protein
MRKQDIILELNKYLQLIKTVENADPSFFPYLYSEKLFQERKDKDKKSYEEYIAKLKKEDPENYLKHLEIQEQIKKEFVINENIDEIRKHSDSQQKQNKLKEEKDKREVALLNYHISKGFSKYIF